MESRRVLVLVAILLLQVLQQSYGQELCLMDGQSPMQPSVPFTGVVKVPVFVHVITANDGITGSVSESVIDQQIALLNSEFSATDLVFELAGISETANDDWFLNVNFSETDPERVAMQSMLSVDPAHVMNIYTLNHDIEGAQAMGFSHFPWKDVETDFKHGLVLDYRTFPGMGGKGGLTSDHGDWAVHEAGHYFGLRHTFDGNYANNVCPIRPEETDCTSQGDQVCDTVPHWQPRAPWLEQCNEPSCGEIPFPTRNHMN